MMCLREAREVELGLCGIMDCHCLKLSVGVLFVVHVCSNCESFKFCRTLRRLSFFRWRTISIFPVQVVFAIKTFVCVSTAFLCQTCWTYDDTMFVICEFMLWCTADSRVLVIIRPQHLQTNTQVYEQ